MTTAEREDLRRLRAEEFGNSWSAGTGVAVARRPSASLRSQDLPLGLASTQTPAERLDGNGDLPDTGVGCWARHELPGTRSAASPQVAHCFEAFQEALPRLRALQSTAVPEPIPSGHMTALDSPWSSHRALGAAPCGRAEHQDSWSPRPVDTAGDGR